VTTGCHSASCLTPEVQSFTCLADEGKFSMTLLPYPGAPAAEQLHLPNVPADVNRERLKHMLESLPGVDRVAVHYGMADDREYSSGDRACTSRGNVVTITFHATSLGVDGDLPALLLDATNAPLSARTYLEEADGTFLRAAMSGGAPSLPAQASEVTKGVRYADRAAPYHAGSGTATLLFKYTVQEGDYSADLEAAGIELPGAGAGGAPAAGIFKSGGGVPADTVAADTNAFPTSAGGGATSAGGGAGGARRRYMASRGSSLAFNRGISVDTAAPAVQAVTPTPGAQLSGSFGVGESVSLAVQFDKNVTVHHHEPASATHQPYLLLETGATNRKAYYAGSAGAEVRFTYVVQAGDSTPDLDYASAAALVVPAGSYIRRAATAPMTDAM
jgi:hypothetical protein